MIKKNSLALVIASALSTTVSVAYAQTNVTVYGVVDGGVAYVSNSGGDGKLWKSSGGNLSGNQLGLKGTEDLGGGLSAIFGIESGFDLMTGKSAQNGRLFGRQSFVGLSSPTWGTVTLGRQYDPLSDLLQPLTADAYSGIFGTPGDVDNYDNSARVNNSIKWTSPLWNGLTFEALYAFGEVAKANGSGQTYGGAVGYANGPLGVSAGVLNIDNGNAAASMRGTSSSDSLFNTAVNSAYSSASVVNVLRAGGQYDFGILTAGAAYSHSEYVADSASTFSETEKYQNASVFARFQVSKALQLTTAYNFTKASGDSSARYHQLGIGADYTLSPRTDIYALAAYNHANGHNGIGTAQATIGSYGIDAGASSQSMVVLGMRHRF